MCLARPAHSLEASTAGGVLRRGASYPLWGWVASAPAARPLANSDYFFFLLALLGAFIPDRAFSLGSGLKKIHTANILVSLFLNHCRAAMELRASAFRPADSVPGHSCPRGPGAPCLGLLTP